MIWPRSFLPVVVSLSTGAWASSIGPVATLPIVNRVIAPDGFVRDTVLAGGSFPGPIIKGNKGDTFKINVVDQLVDTGMDVATSVHWHGINQHRTNAFDGAAFVTQCPIIPGHSFEYKFPVHDQAGTFWYHSHFSSQYCDGLRGPLIVYDPHDPLGHLYDVDDDSTVITIADWYNYPSLDAPAIPSFTSTLINGKGRYAGGPKVPLAVVNVQKGKRYRFRIVSISCDPNFVFSIDNHQLTVIEADGTSTQPLVVDQIQILAAQRYSVVLNANQPVSNYWIRSLPNAANATTNGGINAAILRYRGAPLRDPTTHDTSGRSPLIETNLHPYVKSVVPGKHVPGGADINIKLDFTIAPDFSGFLVNNKTFEFPAVPVLLQVLNGTKRPQDLLPKGTIFGLTKNAVVEVTIPGGTLGGPHPFHLHGHSFYVVRSAGNATYNWNNPIERDTVNLGESPTDLVTIRFVADNPGPWLMHCHIDWHMPLGFAAILAEDVPNIPQTDITSAAWKDLCPTYNRYLQGRPGGNPGHTH